MKILFAIVVGLFCINANAEIESSTSIGSNQNSVKAPRVFRASIKSQPKWSFALGGSQLEENKDISGGGINLGIERSLNRNFALGVSHALYTTSAQYVGPKNQIQNYEWKVNATSGYLNFTPIRHVEGKLEFSALAQLSAMYTNYDGGLLAYGAGLEMDYDNQFALRIERKMSNEFSAISTLSLVAHY